MPFGVVAAVGDPEGTRTVTSIIALLAVLGVALLMLAVWLFRTTRPDPELLAPLEMMGERRWRRGDAVWQRRRLDEIRPNGAMPRERSSAPPALDTSFDDGPSASGFDDLHGAGLDDERDSEPPAARPDSSAARPVAGEHVRRPPSSGDTPYETVRPPVDELPDGEVDPALLASAMAELDDELRRGPQ
ncbi:MAG TPA: hypothetical protein VLA10_04965 [Ilumatobacter sp.]|nr:hypothetical protein [Ilumatobacter sp.]